MFGFVNRVDKVIWPPKRDLSADFSRISPSSDLVALMKSLCLKHSLYIGQITLSTLWIKPK